MCLRVSLGLLRPETQEIFSVLTVGLGMSFSLSLNLSTLKNGINGLSPLPVVCDKCLPTSSQKKKKKKAWGAGALDL